MEGRSGTRQIGVIKATQCPPEIYGIVRTILAIHALAALAADDREAGTIAEIAITLKPKVALWPVGSPIEGIKIWGLGGQIPAEGVGQETVGMRMGMWR